MNYGFPDDFVMTLLGKLMMIGMVTTLSIFVWKRASKIEKAIKNSDGKLSLTGNIKFLKHAMIVMVGFIAVNSMFYQFGIEDYGIPVIVFLGFMISGIIAGYLPTQKNDNEFRGKT